MLELKTTDLSMVTVRALYLLCTHLLTALFLGWLLASCDWKPNEQEGPDSTLDLEAL